MYRSICIRYFSTFLVHKFDLQSSLLGERFVYPQDTWTWMTVMVMNPVAMISPWCHQTASIYTIDQRHTLSCSSTASPQNHDALRGEEALEGKVAWCDITRGQVVERCYIPRHDGQPHHKQATRAHTTAPRMPHYLPRCRFLSQLIVGLRSFLDSRTKEAGNTELERTVEMDCERTTKGQESTGHQYWSLLRNSVLF